MEEASAFPAEEEKAVLEEEGTAPQEGDSSQSPETGEAAVPLCCAGYISRAYLRDVAVRGIIESPEPERSQEPDHVGWSYFESVGCV